MASELRCFPCQLSSSIQKITRLPLNNHPFTQTKTTSLANPKHLRLICAASTQDTQLSENRRSANYQPNAWNYDFVQSLENNLAVTMNFTNFIIFLLLLFNFFLLHFFNTTTAANNV